MLPLSPSCFLFMFMGIAFKCRKSELSCFKGVSKEFELHFCWFVFPYHFYRGWPMWTFQTTSILRQLLRKTSRSCLERKWVSRDQIQARVRKAAKQVKLARVRCLPVEDIQSGIFYIFKIAWMDQPKANNYFVEQKGLRTLELLYCPWSVKIGASSLTDGTPDLLLFCTKRSR